MYKKLPYYIFNSIYSNKVYRFFIWTFLIIMVFFTVNKYKDINILGSVGLIITDYNFLCLCYFEFSFLITKKIHDDYKNNDFLKIRFYNYKKYSNEEQKSNILCQTIYFSITLILIFILLNLLSTADYSIVSINDFKMNSLLFCLYNLSKIYSFTILLAIFNIQIMNLFKITYVYIINILLYFSILINAYLNTKIINSGISFFIGNSLVNTTKYSNYFYDMINFFFHFILIFIIIIIIKRSKKNEIHFD